MPVAIFDFDGTLVYMPSSLVWSEKLPLMKKLTFPFLFAFERLTGRSSYQQKIFQWMVGHDISQTLKKMEVLPPVPKVVEYFKKLSSRGYRMIVMSYSPGIFIQPWLDAQGLSAELICPDFDVENGVIKNITRDEVTRIYLEQPKRAKRDIVEMLGLFPDVSVGDNKKRDVLCDNYKDVLTLQSGYQNKLSQVFNNLDKLF